MYFNFLSEFHRDVSEELVPVIGGAIRPAFTGKVFCDVHGQTSRDLNPEAGLNIILYSDWL